jgi:hypothetical protein
MVTKTQIHISQEGILLEYLQEIEGGHVHISKIGKEVIL